MGTTGTWDGAEAGGVSGVTWAYAKPTAPTMVAAATAEVRVLEKFIINLLEGKVGHLNHGPKETKTGSKASW